VKWLARHGSGERTHISHVLAILPDYRGYVPPMLVTCAQRLLCLPRMLAHRISAIRSEMGVRSSMSNHGHQSGDHLTDSALIGNAHTAIGASGLASSSCLWP
jgi:hypothetical protein